LAEAFGKRLIKAWSTEALYLLAGNTPPFSAGIEARVADAAAMAWQ